VSYVVILTLCGAKKFEGKLAFMKTADVACESFFSRFVSSIAESFVGR